MENASKALIIAGSILLSILIIALGMYIYSQATGSTDDTTLSQMEVSSFNGKFDKYEGLQAGSKVSALIDALVSNARSNNGASERPLVTFGTIVANPETKVTGGDTATGGYIFQLKAMNDALIKSHRYTIEMEEDTDTDLIHTITITE